MDRSGLGRLSSSTAGNRSPLLIDGYAAALAQECVSVQEEKHKVYHGSRTLAEKIPQSMLSRDSDQSWVLDVDSSMRTESIWGSQFMSTSPQSTLAGATNWELPTPSPGSNGDLSSGVSSPPVPVATGSFGKQDEENGLDLLYVELLRLKLEDEINKKKQVLQLLHLKQHEDYQRLWKLRQRQAFHLSNEAHAAMMPSSPNSARWSSTHNSSNKGSDHSKGYFHSKFKRDGNNSMANGRAGQMKELAQSKRRGWVAGLGDGNNRHPSHAPRYAGRVHNGSTASSGPTLASGSGMRAVFLEVPGARECNGTGVFLPRRTWKPSCSTVLLPSRIVQALNLNADSLAYSPIQPSSTPLQREFFVRSHLLKTSSQQQTRELEVVDKRETEWAFRARPSRTSSGHDNPIDVRLPTEWTY